MPRRYGPAARLPAERHPLPRALAATALALAVLSTACTQPPPEAEPSPSPTATGSPSPLPPSPIPVAGTREVTIQSVGNGPVVFNANDPASALAPPDEPAIDVFAAAVGDWLDAHLDSVQTGGEGLLDDVAAAGLLDVAGRRLERTASTAIASPDDPVATAHYVLTVYHDGAPEWLYADVAVETFEGSSSRLGFVFTPSAEAPGATLVAIEADVPDPPRPSPTTTDTGATATPTGEGSS